MTHKLKPYWDRVNAVLAAHPDIAEKGYVEIVANGVTYRSIDHEYDTLWVSWKPFRWLYHFSELQDPDATVRWVSQ